MRRHLAEVSLAGQSGEMAKKNQQRILLNAGAHIDRNARQIDQPELPEINFVHENEKH
jgi:hypothetical protein